MGIDVRVDIDGGSVGLTLGSVNFNANQVDQAGFQVASVTLTAAQLLSLSGGTSTIVVVPANAGRVIIPTYWSVNYIYGGAIYTFGSADCAFIVQYANGSSEPCVGINLTDFVDQTVNQIYSDSTQGMLTPSTDAIGLPLIMKLQGTTPTIASGNGTMVIKIWYSAITAS